VSRPPSPPRWPSSTTREQDKAYRLGAEYRSDRIWAQGQHILVGPDAETGMGFVTRTDIRSTDGLGQYTFVVFNDEQGEEGRPGYLVNRGLAVKGTWLVRF